MFVESYGRAAVEHQVVSPEVNAVLNRGTDSLRAAGFSSRSAFLTSSTFAGVSWLAHGTLQSGLWIDSQLRYNQLLQTDRLTLSAAFDKRAGWRTVAAVPSNTEDSPEGQSFYQFDTMYDSRNVGYAGPKFGYASMPDQYTLAALQRQELAPADRSPVMAEVDLVSSHGPWVPLPRMVDWGAVGDGSVFTSQPDPGTVGRGGAGRPGPEQGGLPRGDPVHVERPDLVRGNLRRRRPGGHRRRQPPAGQVGQRRGCEPRRSDHDHRAGPGGDGSSRVLGLAARNAAESGRSPSGRWTPFATAS